MHGFFPLRGLRRFARVVTSAEQLGYVAKRLTPFLGGHMLQDTSKVLQRGLALLPGVHPLA